MPRGSNLTKEHQQFARSRVKRESLVAAGKKGFAATAGRYGRDFAGNFAAKYRLDHPTSLEVSVQETLTKMGHTAQREVKIGKYYVDFLVGNVVVEADGAYWHQDKRRDHNRDRAIKRRGYLIVRLSEAAIKSGMAEKIITNFIK